MLLTYKRVRELFEYSAETGDLIWRPRPREEFDSEAQWKTRNTLYAGRVAGSRTHYGYMKIKIEGRFFPAHRIVWLWCYAVLPLLQIDHIDHDGCNNRLANLRLVTNQENARNIRLPKDNRSGIVGVRWRKKEQRWHAYIHVNKCSINLGFYTDKSLAIAARRDAERQYGFHPNHGRAA